MYLHFHLYILFEHWEAHVVQIPPHGRRGRLLYCMIKITVVKLFVANVFTYI